MVTLYNAYHQGFSHGHSCTEATNFAQLEEQKNYFNSTTFCSCRYVFIFFSVRNCCFSEKRITQHSFTFIHIYSFHFVVSEDKLKNDTRPSTNSLIISTVFPFFQLSMCLPHHHLQPQQLLQHLLLQHQLLQKHQPALPSTTIGRANPDARCNVVMGKPIGTAKNAVKLKAN